ncbi:MAG TPA: hypothetical protein VFB59_00495, partial [Candidatus Saccharimonadales bacterium]|nr:hypothetical protein [Candidatus Saccharimonadales bacterium]
MSSIPKLLPHINFPVEVTLFKPRKSEDAILPAELSLQPGEYNRMFVDCALASAHERLVKEAGGKLLKTQIIADLRLGWPPLRISTAKPPDLELKNQHHLTNHVESCGQFRSEVRQVADTVYETSSHNVGRNLGYLLLGLHTMAGQSRRGLDRYSLWVSEGFKV